MPLKLVLKFIMILSLIHSISCDCGTNKKLDQILAAIEKLEKCCDGGGTVYKDCKDAQEKGVTTSGIQTISPDGGTPFKAYCDMVTDGGGWTVFQKRQDGSQNFYLGWAEYFAGFGDLNVEFWLGLDRIHRLTTGTANTLRIDLVDFTNDLRYAKYSIFGVAGANDGYRLTVGGYSGSAGDSLIPWQNGMRFTTKDRDNDQYSGVNCAVRYSGAWWYNACHQSNLNGLYLRGDHSSLADGVNWVTWRGYYYSLAKTEMKVRRN